MMNKGDTKAKTLIERHGFKDKDLTSPKHDEIVLEVLRRLRKGKIPRELQKFEDFNFKDRPCWHDQECTRKGKYCHLIQQWELDSRHDYQELGMLDKRRGGVTGKCGIWEGRVIHDGKCGFVDNTFWCYKNHYLGLAYYECEPINIKRKYTPEFTILKGEGKYKTIVGFIDIRGVIKAYNKTNGYNIEVKTTIPSYGAFLREINFYSQFVDYPWVIISPDTRFKEDIEAEGILFYEYPLDDRWE